MQSVRHSTQESFPGSVGIDLHIQQAGGKGDIFLPGSHFKRLGVRLLSGVLCACPWQSQAAGKHMPKGSSELCAVISFMMTELPLESRVSIYVTLDQSNVVL